MVDIAKAILLRITARSFRTRTRDLFSAIYKNAGGNRKNSSLLRLISPKIKTLFQHISTRIVPAIYPICIGMKRGKVTWGPVLRRRTRLLKKTLGYISIWFMFRSGRTYNQQNKSRAPYRPTWPYNNGKSDVSHICGDSFPTCLLNPIVNSQTALQLHHCRIKVKRR